MTDREIIRRCVHFEDPPRAGLYFSRFGWNDTVDVFDFFIKDKDGVDPWGIKWEVHPDVPSIGIPKTPPLKGEGDAERLKAPDPKAFADATRTNLAGLAAADRDKYRFVATSAGIFERVQYFLSMQGLFEAMHGNPGFVHRLITFCADFWVSYLEELGPLKGELDALYMFDDWGTQEGAMISPAMFAEFYSEPYRRVVGAAHASGMDFWLHSCGRVTDLIGAFIAAGMDLVNPYQSGACGYEEVARRYAGRIAFLTTVDVQTTLRSGPRERILEECGRLERWGTPRGGLIAASYGYDIAEENERIVFDYFRNRPCAGGPRPLKNRRAPV